MFEISCKVNMVPNGKIKLNFWLPYPPPPPTHISCHDRQLLLLLTDKHSSRSPWTFVKFLLHADSMILVKRILLKSYTKVVTLQFMWITLLLSWNNTSTKLLLLRHGFTNRIWWRHRRPYGLRDFSRIQDHGIISHGKKKKKLSVSRVSSISNDHALKDLADIPIYLGQTTA